MKPLVATLALVLVLVLVLAPALVAQQHHGHADTTKAAPTRQDGMEHDRMGQGADVPNAPPSTRADDVRAAEAASRTADRFFAAVATGDRAAVEALLLPGAVVLEGGRIETRTEYLGGHFEHDAAFLGALAHEPLQRRTEVAGDAAWVTSTSRLHGTREGRAVDLDSAELLVLRRDAAAPDGWGVAAVHWSSSSRK